jgi:hypothetical protein
LPVLRRLSREGVRIVVNTKPPEEQGDLLRAQTLKTMPMLQELGVEIYFTGGHHRKLAIINQQILWEGSLNILSPGDSCEIMRKISLCLQLFPYYNIIPSRREQMRNT